MSAGELKVACNWVGELILIFIRSGWKNRDIVGGYEEWLGLVVSFGCEESGK